MILLCGDDGTRTRGPLLAKPDPAGSLPAGTENGAGHDNRGIARGCLLGIGRDFCEWHGSGTAGLDEHRGPCPVGAALA